MWTNYAMNVDHGFQINARHRHRSSSAFSIGLPNSHTDAAAKTLSESSSYRASSLQNETNVDLTNFQTVGNQFANHTSAPTINPFKNFGEFRVEHLLSMNRPELRCDLGVFQGYQSLSPLDVSSSVGFHVPHPPRCSSMSEPRILSSFSALLSDGLRASTADATSDSLFPVAGFRANEMGGLRVDVGESSQLTFGAEGAGDELGIRRNMHMHAMNCSLMNFGIGYTDGFGTNYHQANGIDRFDFRGFSASDGNIPGWQSFNNGDQNGFAKNDEISLNIFHDIASIESVSNPENIVQNNACAKFQSISYSENQFVGTVVGDGLVCEAAGTIATQVPKDTVEIAMPSFPPTARPTASLGANMLTTTASSLSDAINTHFMKSPSSVNIANFMPIKPDPEKLDLVCQERVDFCTDAPAVEKTPCELNNDVESGQARQHKLSSFIPHSPRNEGADVSELEASTVATPSEIDVPVRFDVVETTSTSIATIVTSPLLPATCQMESNASVVRESKLVNKKQLTDKVTRLTGTGTEEVDSDVQRSDARVQPINMVTCTTDAIVQPSEYLNDQVASIISAWLKQPARKKTQEPMKEDRRRRVHQCKVCGKIVKKAKYLVVHMITHTGDKPYSCTHKMHYLWAERPLVVHLMLQTKIKSVQKN